MNSFEMIALCVGFTSAFLPSCAIVYMVLSARVRANENRVREMQAGDERELARRAEREARNRRNA